MIKINKNKLKIVWFIGFCGVILGSFTQPTLARAEILNGWDNENAYRPAPVLFLHGFAEGSPTATWTEDEKHHPNIDFKLEPYFRKYFSGDPVGSIKVLTPDTRYAYLEVINFIGKYTGTDAYVRRQQLIDRNSSVDPYQAGDYYVLTSERNIGDPGWSDKVKGAVEQILNGYGTDKVILVCESMGGLAAREYFRVNGGNDTLRLITIATPHLGSNWTIRARDLRRTQKIGWFIPFLGWQYSLNVKAVDVSIERQKLIDIDGDAVRDMEPGSSFLHQLNTSLQPPEVDYFAICGKVWYTWYTGDGVVSLKSARGEGVLTLKDEALLKAAHGDVPKVAATGDPSPLLKFIDYTKPVVEITSPDPDASPYTEINSLSFNVHGELSREYLPADCILKIKVEKEGGGTASVVKEGKLLHPSDLWNPNDDNSVVAEFDEEITVSQLGIYTIFITVTNPGGFVSETKTTRVKLTDIPGTGGDWRDVLTLLNQKRADVKKGPLSVPHPENIDMDGVFTIRWGTVDILQDYGFTGLADALNCAGYTRTTWSEGFACKNEIYNILNLMTIITSGLNVKGVTYHINYFKLWYEPIPDKPFNLDLFNAQDPSRECGGVTIEATRSFGTWCNGRIHDPRRIRPYCAMKHIVGNSSSTLHIQPIEQARPNFKAGRVLSTTFSNLGEWFFLRAYFLLSIRPGSENDEWWYQYYDYTGTDDRMEPGTWIGLDWIKSHVPNDIIKTGGDIYFELPPNTYRLWFPHNKYYTMSSQIAGHYGNDTIDRYPLPHEGKLTKLLCISKEVFKKLKAALDEFGLGPKPASVKPKTSSRQKLPKKEPLVSSKSDDLKPDRDKCSCRISSSHHFKRK